MDAAGVNRASRWIIHSGIRAAALARYPRFLDPVPWSVFAADLDRSDLQEQLRRPPHG
jgi:hypothetical protein